MTVRAYPEPATADTDEQLEADVYYPEGNYAPAVLTRRRSRPPLSPPKAPVPPPTPNPERRSPSRALGLVVGGALLVLGVILACQLVIFPTWQWLYNQWHYGDAVVSQLDADVGHGGSSHFLSIYYKGHLVVIELLPDHPEDNRTYSIGGFMGSPDRQPVELLVRDVNHDGKPDLVVQIKSTGFETVLYNTGKQFSGKAGGA